MLTIGPVTVKKHFLQAGEEHEISFTLKPPDAAFRAKLAEASAGHDSAPTLEDLLTPRNLAPLVIDWSGLCDVNEKPLPCEADTIVWVCGVFPQLHAALVEALFEALPQQVRGNSRPSPAGSTTGEGEKPAGPAAA